jgi:hypothetical protein
LGGRPERKADHQIVVAVIVFFLLLQGGWCLFRRMGALGLGGRAMLELRGE